MISQNSYYLLYFFSKFDHWSLPSSLHLERFATLEQGHESTLLSRHRNRVPSYLQVGARYTPKS